MPSSEELRTALNDHIVDVWFPRKLERKRLDLQYGGFLCDFDRSWQPCGSHNKLMEFQARQTWLAAELLQSIQNNKPDHKSDNERLRQERLRKATLHGFHYLRDVLWDHQFGGWFHQLNRAGKPLEEGTKHVHGMIYGISACCAVYTATQEMDALRLAQEAFEWIERYAHDDEYGGYRGFLTQDGNIIQNKAENPLQWQTDTIGVPLGHKDANVHSDLLDTLHLLYRVWPDAKVATRLIEVAEIMATRMALPSGAVFPLCQPDWRPIPHIMRYGFSFQTASRLLQARDILEPQIDVLKTAQCLVDFCIHNAWDADNGGMFFGGPATPPMELEGQNLRVRRKSWWVQFESLKALMSLCCAVESNEVYQHYFSAQWHYLKHYFLDHERGGIYAMGLDTLAECWPKLRLESAPGEVINKGNIWKDGSHEGRALLYCIQQNEG